MANPALKVAFIVMLLFGSFLIFDGYTASGSGSGYTRTSSATTTTVTTPTTHTYTSSTSTSSSLPCLNGQGPLQPGQQYCSSSGSSSSSSSSSKSSTEAGFLLIQASSSGGIGLVAQAFVDGNSVGYTPVIVPLTAGTHSISCGSLQGFQAPVVSPNSITMTGSGSVPPVTCTYTSSTPVAPTPGELTVTSVDQYGDNVGAPVYLDGVYFGNAPQVNYQVPIGIHSVSCGYVQGFGNPTSVNPTTVTITSGSGAGVTCTYYNSLPAGCTYYNPSTGACSSSPPGNGTGQYAQSIFGSGPLATASEISLGVLLDLMGILGLIFVGRPKRTGL